MSSRRTYSVEKEAVDVYELEHTLAAFIRAFGLHQAEQTPCGVSVSVSEAHTLTEIARTGGLTQSELVNFLRLEKSTVSRLVKGLNKRNWITRDAHPTDGRAQLLKLTSEGEKKAAQIAAARREKFAALTQALPETKRDAVLAALSTLVEAIYASEQVS